MGLCKLNIIYNLFSDCLGLTSTVSDEETQSLKQFVMLLYDHTSNCSNVNECKHELFTKNRAIENLPPTLDALKLDINGSAYRASELGFV